jgi:integrase
MAGARIELPFATWPASDRAAWEALFRKGNRLDGRGAAVHWSAATRKTNAKHYARWLGWLATNGLLEGDLTPWERASPACVEAYARSLIERVAAGTMAPCTVASALIGLKRVLTLMHAQADWRWLKDLTNRLKRWAEPARENPARDLDAGAMLTRLLAELEACARGPLGKRREQLMFRDTLIVTLILVCPIRLRNLAMMQADRHLYRVGPEWHLRFDGSETKNGQPIHLVIPAELDPFLASFLERIRPAFTGTADSAHVWPACKGRPMARETLYDRVRMRSRDLFGVALSPHAFRGLAATALAESSPEDALYARPLLGHGQPETTERHYIRASQLKAARAISTALRQIRNA